MTFRLTLLRHGQSEWQVGKYDDRDSRLTALGHVQATYLSERVTEMINEEQNINIYCSSLVRAKQSLQGIPIEYSVDDRLREAEFPVSCNLAQRDTAFDTTAQSSPSSSYLAFKRTVLEFLSEAATPGGQNCILMCHGGVIKTVFRILVGNDAVDFKVGNCSVSEIVWSNGRWKFKSINDLSHIPHQFAT
ncbi:histidine phosphatase family protein [Pseudaestuariivita rosea]|uniref:histidine phosphatase family protein n=1 Tax=Pseudaestuariivita rosea TaxID=2763263 RepID=UPI001ABA3581|nr:histidine phosphatase family protein [Pseudaestuariivita rosea]